MYAQDEANIRGMQEQREVADIAGLSSQYNAGNAMLWQGVGGIAQSGISAISGGAFGEGATDEERDANKAAREAARKARKNS
jgi:hypothetical protein